MSLPNPFPRGSVSKTLLITVTLMCFKPQHPYISASEKFFFTVPSVDYLFRMCFLNRFMLFCSTSNLAYACCWFLSETEKWCVCYVHSKSRDSLRSIFKKSCE